MELDHPLEGEDHQAFPSFLEEGVEVELLPFLLKAVVEGHPVLVEEVESRNLALEGVEDLHYPLEEVVEEVLNIPALAEEEALQILALVEEEVQRNQAWEVEEALL